MTSITASEARQKLNGLIDEVALSRRPILIKGQQHNAVLISEEHWNAINESLLLTSIPGMKNAIVEGLATDITDCSKHLDW